MPVTGLIYLFYTTRVVQIAIKLTFIGNQKVIRKHGEENEAMEQWRTQEFCSGGRGSTNSVEDRGQGSGGGSPLVRGSVGSCNLVQEISFHIVKSS